MALQGVDNVYDLAWVDGVKYGDVFLRNEVEQSKYNFEHADTDALFEQFNTTFGECERLAGLGLALPAYDQAIATSHVFNLLDARGAISVAERQQYIRRIRELACRCAEAWVEHTPPVEVVETQHGAVVSEPDLGAEASGSRELLVEIHCEELPASYVRPALAALRDGLLGLLEGLEHGEVRTWATPRRLAVTVAGLQATRPETRTLVTGPPAARAFVDGQPTRAAQGFARGRGVDVSELQIVAGPKGEVVAVEVTEGGEAAVELLSAGLDQVIRGLPFPKSMEWGSGGVRFARPIHRVNVVYDGVRVQGVAVGLPFGHTTDAHRLAMGTRFEFRSTDEWLRGLRARGVEPDLATREQKIRELLDPRAGV
jgi:glycyl-tRNA synthetase